jgi:hypothetical protein
LGIFGRAHTTTAENDHGPVTLLLGKDTLDLRRCQGTPLVGEVLVYLESVVPFVAEVVRVVERGTLLAYKMCQCVLVRVDLSMTDLVSVSHVDRSAVLRMIVKIRLVKRLVIHARGPKHAPS